MEHRDHVDLIRKGVPQAGGIWADFGSGDGAFTLALREVAGPEVEIYSIDKDERRLRDQEGLFRSMFPGSNVHFVRADFTRALDLPPVDGMVMANSLHYSRDKEKVLRHAVTYLKPGGSFVLVEYNVDSGNMWVPHPLSIGTFQRLAPKVGLANARLLAVHPSRFLHEIYAAHAVRVDENSFERDD
jgi:ubiquinone/menaquinone biosynthesis C-methylase UbiE